MYTIISTNTAKICCRQILVNTRKQARIYIEQQDGDLPSKSKSSEAGLISIFLNQCSFW